MDYLQRAFETTVTRCINEKLKKKHRTGGEARQAAGIWRTKKGIDISLQAMNTSHMINCLTKVWNDEIRAEFSTINDSESSSYRREWIRIFHAELKKRRRAHEIGPNF